MSQVTQVYVKLTKTRLCLGLPPSSDVGNWSGAPPWLQVGKTVRNVESWSVPPESCPPDSDAPDVEFKIYLENSDWAFSSVIDACLLHKALGISLTGKTNKQQQQKTTHTQKKKTLFSFESLLCQGIFSHRQDLA